MALAAIGLLAALAVPTVVNAATAAECQLAVAEVRAEVEAGSFSGRQAAKEQASLLGKLEAASESLAAGKSAGAVQKLNDVRLHVVTISGAGKLDAADAAAIVDDVDAAIACVNSISA